MSRSAPLAVGIRAFISVRPVAVVSAPSTRGGRARLIPIDDAAEAMLAQASGAGSLADGPRSLAGEFAPCAWGLRWAEVRCRTDRQHIPHEGWLVASAIIGERKYYLQLAADGSRALASLIRRDGCAKANQQPRKSSAHHLRALVARLHRSASGLRTVPAESAPARRQRKKEKP